MKIVHFIGASKPWRATLDPNGEHVPDRPQDAYAIEHLKHWWHVYNTEVKPGFASMVSTKF